MKKSNLLSATAILSSALLLSACGGGAANQTDGGGAATGAGGGGSSAENEKGYETLPSGIDGGPDFDLAGKTITATTPHPGAITSGTLLAYERLRDWGAEVDIVVLTTVSGVQTLIADRADIASQGSDEVVLGEAEGAELAAIGATATAQPYVLVAKKGLSSVNELEGQTLGMSGPSGFDALLSRYALEDVGMENSDVNFVQIGGSPERATALLTGQVDAATIFLEDWEEISRKTDDLELVMYMAELVPDAPAWAYFAKESYWQENPEVATALACANLQANTWINEDKDRWLEYTEKVVEGATPEALSAIYDSAQEIDMWPTEPEKIFSLDGVASLSDAMLETGEISEAVPAEEIANLSYMKEAAAMGCGQK